LPLQNRLIEFVAKICGTTSRGAASVVEASGFVARAKVVTVYKVCIIVKLQIVPTGNVVLVVKIVVFVAKFGLKIEFDFISFKKWVFFCLKIYSRKTLKFDFKNLNLHSSHSPLRTETAAFFHPTSPCSTSNLEHKQ
jgi:hypothetical protein